MGWGGARPNSGPKKNPNKPRAVATTKVRPQTVPAQASAPQPGGSGLDPKYVAGLVETLAAAGYKLREGGKDDAKSPFRLPQVPPGVTPPNPSRLGNAYGIKDAPTMAMDEAASSWASSQWGNYSGLAGFLAAEGAAFPGYTALAELAQLPEYRIISETIADDATREWIEYDVAGDETDERDKAERKNNDPVGEIERERDPDEQAKRLRQAGLTDKVKALTEDQERLEARDRFYSVIRDDGFYGRAHMFLGFGEDGTADLANAAGELRQDIGDGRNEMSRGKVDKSNPLRELKVIEAVWTYPQAYNAINPLLPYWYDPQQWYVMGVEVHQSRLLKFIGHPVPDLLKPAYSFGGISLTQMATPYVNIWLQTRESVAALIKAFSVMVLETDLQTQTAPGAAAAGLVARAQLFNMLRDNMGLMMINGKSEKFSNVSTPLGSLDALQHQSLEHMCVEGSTLIETDRGSIPIKDVDLNDRVLTREGFAPIKWIGITGHADTLVEIEAGGSVLRTTYEHPIWSESTSEFVSARNVSPFHSLLVLDSEENMANRSRGVVDGGGEPKQDITEIRKLAAFFTASCGKRIEALSRMATKFITKMTTASTTIGAIWNSLQLPSTEPAIAGLASTSLTESSPKNVVSAATSLRAFITMIGRGFARMPADKEFAAASSVDRLQRGTVSAAQKSSRLNGNAPLDFVAMPVCSERVTRVCEIKVPFQPVYNLEVLNGPPEFFANGILVHNCLPSRIPLVKMTGNQPMGLNASSDGEIRLYYDTITSFQHRVIRPNLTRVVNFEQCGLFGDVDPKLKFKFKSLYQMTPKEQADLEKAEAERDEKFIAMGALAPEEVRTRIIKDDRLPYTDLDPNDVPDLLDEEAQGLEPEGGRPQPQAGGDKPEKSEED